MLEFVLVPLLRVGVLMLLRFVAVGLTNDYNKVASFAVIINYAFKFLLAHLYPYNCF